MCVDAEKSKAMDQRSTRRKYTDWTVNLKQKLFLPHEQKHCSSEGTLKGEQRPN